MTSIAASARICATTPEAAFLLASFMSFSHDRGRRFSGVRHRGLKKAWRHTDVYAKHPTTSIRFDLSPHSANIDGASIED
jgi:hypothetical protein